MSAFSVPDRHSLSAEAYLSQHGVDVFLRDAVQQILNKRGDQPLLMMSQYFGEVASNKHVSGREFAFVDACARNRLAFVRLFQRTFERNIEAQERIVVEDYHQLCQMICPTFPWASCGLQLGRFQTLNLSLQTSLGLCTYISFIGNFSRRLRRSSSMPQRLSVRRNPRRVVVRKRTVIELPLTRAARRLHFLTATWC